MSEEKTKKSESIVGGSTRLSCAQRFAFSLMYSNPQFRIKIILI